MIEKISYGYPFKPEMGCFGFSSSLLVKESKITILFDTGGYNLRRELLRNISDIDLVVISHLHFDHCSNLDLFVKKNTPIIISKKEIKYYEKMKDSDNDLFRYFDYLKKDLNLILIDSEYIIDDKIKVISTPGHTPGHISLEIINKDDFTILAGDALKTFQDYENLNESGNAYNSDLYKQTKLTIKRKYNTIFPGHDNVIIDGKRGKVMEVHEF